MPIRRPARRLFTPLVLVACVAAWLAAMRPPLARAAEPRVDFNRDVRRILSDRCFTCHGPDDAERQGGIRFDLREGALVEGDSGEVAIVPEHPEQSEMIRRITTDDGAERMPPMETGKPLSADEVATLTQWIREGAGYARHWSYIRPERPAVPQVADPRGAKHPIDAFILERLERDGLTMLPPADRFALVRRLSLDLTGLPPTIQEVDQFVADTDPRAYENLVDRLLEKQSFGEHWARKWLDLARYADSAGYADDPPRTIWAYRDYVIRALNENRPFDQFTIEQLAGDLLPAPTDEQLIATAFHRNTLTNNEGGTNDEEFRNVAIVDRVNTTMAVWMGTTIGCCQCHNHKYDPISQEEFFRLFAIFNNSADADRRDESPLHQVWTPALRARRQELEAQLTRLQDGSTASPGASPADVEKWEAALPERPAWNVLRPASIERASRLPATVGEDGTIQANEAIEKDTYTINIPIGEAQRINAIRLEALAAEELPGKGPGLAGGNFVITHVTAQIERSTSDPQRGRFVRIENLGEDKILSLAEVEVFRNGLNVALQGQATQSSTAFKGPAELAIDGKTDGNFQAGTTTHTGTERDPWWEVDLGASGPVDRLVIWNRTDNSLHTRLSHFRVVVLDADRNAVWTETVTTAPNPRVELSPNGTVGIPFKAAYADFAQAGFEAANVIQPKQPDQAGWAVGGATGQSHRLTLEAESPVEVPAGSRLAITIAQRSKHANHLIGRFRLSATHSAELTPFAELPSGVLAALNTAADQRTDQQRRMLADHVHEQQRSQALETAKKELAALKPITTVPIMQELPADKGRKTHVQLRGNYLVKGAEVTPGLPAAFPRHAGPEAPDRMTLARWLVDPANPLTARVIANRYWEAIFGVGIVRTSEEFGMQGDPPSHPRLLDWLATELIASGWDTKHLLRSIVTSAAYRQSAHVSPEAYERDPENRLLARGPRFRLSAEMIRDQALFAAGLLSTKMHGPPVRPPQPNIGLNAAFGSGIDWKTSGGEDRHRRGIYTTWRRSNPYPSMATFDAPNREVCIIRRDRTNTPLQALVTLNDPVYVEAAQALARRMIAAGDTPEERIRHGFRRCVARHPTDREMDALSTLFQTAKEELASTPDKARSLATDPLGPVPEELDLTEVAAMTVVGNVLLNMDEMLMKR